MKSSLSRSSRWYGALTAMVLGLLPAAIHAADVNLLVTEIQSNQSANKPAGSQDYWELYNYGATSVNLSGYRWHDSGKSFNDAAVIPDGTIIAPGESIVFTSATPSVFRAWWNLPATVQVIQSVGAPGLGGNDGITLFDSGGNQLFFFSYAAAGFTKEDGNPSTGGHAGPSAGGSADSVALIWVPTSGTASPRYTFATGSNFGSFTAVAPATDVGSPGTTHAGPKSIDLSTYVRVGRYSLPEPTRTTPPNGINLLAQEASGVTYNWDTDSLFITADGGTAIVQVSKTGQLIDTMTLATGSSPQGTDFYDPEGITYVGNGQFVMSEERDRQLVLFTYAAGTTLTRANTKTVKLGTFSPNEGTEGLSWDPLTGGFIVLKELNPIGIFHTTVDFDAGTASNGSPTAANSINLFDPALTGFTDVADVFALSNIPSLSGTADFSRMLLLSQENGKIHNIDRAGNIQSTLTITADPGDTLTVANQQHEGLTMDRAGILYIVNENGGGNINFPELWVYAPSTVPNQAPTAMVLNNQISSFPENTSTSSRVKVADIVVTDDGLGVNTLSLTGTDVASFEIIGTALYIKSGVTLDFETKSSYTVTVTVDDTTLGATPDASVSYTLTLTDVTNETPSTPSIIISEVAPWSSGNSPIGADWFEVTNTGTNAVDITGWKVDDNSASFGNALALNGITSIAPGESVIFIETANLTAAKATFLYTWFGSQPPANLQIGSYTGGGIGLGTGGDAVNLYNASGTLQASVSFGAAPAGPTFATFDNAEGLNNTAISRLSTVNLYDAFTAVNDSNEIGSPGTTGKLIISEVAPWSSGDSPVGADWFEISNTGARPINIEGWRVDDSSESFGGSVALNGIISIAPGESVIFLETANLATARTAFINTWFGGNAPTGLQIGNYTGSGVGLGTGGDALNLYDNLGRLRAKVVFGTSPSAAPFATFDNATGLNGVTISQLSVTGRYGARAVTSETGSPGTTGKLVITEVAPWSSGSSPVAADWFELSNTSPRVINIAGWKVDDSSASFANALALNGITNIAPGESVIFLESDNLAAIKTSFLNTWFGANPPASLQIGNYTGGGIGLSTSGDAVNIYNAGGILQASVTFGASSASAPFKTFDNAAGLDNVSLTSLSSIGLYGAFAAANDANEVGSPGRTMTVPLLSLASGEAFYTAPASIMLQASVMDADGKIVRVKFMVGNTVLATLTAPPYQYNWQNVPAGSYYVTVRGEDNLGGAYVSEVQHILVGTVGIAAPEKAPGTFRFQFVGLITGKVHLIQASTDLVNWTTIGTVTPGSNSMQFEDTNADSNVRRYYRVIQQDQP
ncbi:MAG TPA: lamin tail domain-containing protein [Verrucomicrobiae bacterium]